MIKHKYPSARGQSRFGPRTMATLLGVILFTACCSDNRDKNWTRYLISKKRRRKEKKKKTHKIYENFNKYKTCKAMLHRMTASTRSVNDVR